MSQPSFPHDAGEAHVSIDAQPSVMPRVLLVEDERTIREHLAQVLASEFDVTTAADGTQALLAVLRSRPDVIVTDIVMPGLDGVELVRLLRDTPSTSTIPILLTSGKAAEDLRIEGFEVGADAYLAKPYSIRELKARMRAMLDGARRRDEVHFRVIADAVPVLMWRADAENRGTWFNKTWLEFTGRALADELGHGWGQVVHPDDLEPALRKCQENLERRAPLEMEFRMRRHDGEYRWMLDRGNPVYDGPDGAFSGYIGTCVDITELKRSSDALLAAEQRYKAFVANSTEAIWRYELRQPLDLGLPVEAQLAHILEHGYLAELNNVTARMYGFERAEDMVGMPLTQTLPADDEAAQAYLRLVVESRFSLPDVESQEIDRDGRTRHFSNSITPVIENGRLLRAWGTQRDITDRKRAEEQMKLEQRRKDEFLATLAHELRNPLAPIRTGIHILRSRDMPPGESKKILEMMERQMTHMVLLLDDLLDVSRISRGRLELRREPVNLARVIDEAMETCAPLVEARGHRIVINGTNEALAVDGDPARLAQVFANLISNSAKYTDPGGEVVLTLSRENGDAVVSVRDNGSGIPPEALEKVFELFSQVRPQPGASEGGLGIGLSVVRTLVEMHGGSVSARSEGAGTGSTFEVRLPLGQVTQAST